MIWRLFILALALYAQAQSATFLLAPEAGLMQQPASQYYLFVRGGQAAFATDSENFHVSLRYLARPKFEQNGFSETEQGYFGLVGTKLNAFDKGPLFLKASIGYGQMQGEIKKDGQRVSYRMQGLALDVTGVYRWKIVDLHLTHMTFLGYADAFQTEKRVLWPFQYFLAGLGMVL